MRIRLPLTLAIIEGFLVRVGHSSFVIPLEMVEECVESDADGGIALIIDASALIAQCQQQPGSAAA